MTLITLLLVCACESCMFEIYRVCNRFTCLGVSRTGARDVPKFFRISDLRDGRKEEKEKGIRNIP